MTSCLIFLKRSKRYHHSNKDKDIRSNANDVNIKLKSSTTLIDEVYNLVCRCILSCVINKFRFLFSSIFFFSLKPKHLSWWRSLFFLNVVKWKMVKWLICLLILEYFVLDYFSRMTRAWSSKSDESLYSRLFTHLPSSDVVLTQRHNVELRTRTWRPIFLGTFIFWIPQSSGVNFNLNPNLSSSEFTEAGTISWVLEFLPWDQISK